MTSKESSLSRKFQNKQSKLISEDDIMNIKNLVKKNNVTMINGPTGVGKSTVIPVELSDQNKKILVSLPTIISAKNLYYRMSKQYPNIKFGYAAEGKRQYDNDTKIIYATAGHVKKRLIELFLSDEQISSELDNYIIILDEVHTLSVDNSMIMILWNELRRRNKNIKLVLMTATEINNFNEIEVNATYKLTGSSYTVTNVFLSNEELEKPYQKNIISKCLEHVSSNRSGHILCFVPGTNVCKSIYDELLKIVSKKKYDIPVKIFSIYGKALKEIIAQALLPTTLFKKVIIATNAAESSVTIADVSVVIDSMREKVPGRTSRGTLLLTEKMISKQSSFQRKGRTGRNCNGIYIPIISKEVYFSKYQQNSDTQNKKPNILEVNIDKELIELLSIQIDPLERIKDLSERVYTKYIDNFIDLGIIVNDRISNLGYFVSKVPLEIRNAKFLWEWYKNNDLLYWGALMSTLLDFDFSVILNHDSNLKEFIGDDQLHTIINILFQLEKDTKSSYKLKLDDKWMEEWCIKNNINKFGISSFINNNLQVLSACKRFFKLDNVEIKLVTVNELRQMSIKILSNTRKDMVLNLKQGGYFDYDYNKYIISKNIPSLIKDYKSLISLSELWSETNSKMSRVVMLSCSVDYKNISNTEVKKQNIKPDKKTITLFDVKRTIINDVKDNDWDRISPANPKDIGINSLDYIPSVLLPSIMGNTLKLIFSTQVNMQSQSMPSIDFFTYKIKNKKEPKKDDDDIIFFDEESDDDIIKNMLQDTESSEEGVIFDVDIELDKY